MPRGCLELTHLPGSTPWNAGFRSPNSSCALSGRLGLLLVTSQAYGVGKRPPSAMRSLGSIRKPSSRSIASVIRVMVRNEGFPPPRRIRNTEAGCTPASCARRDGPLKLYREVWERMSPSREIVGSKWWGDVVMAVVSCGLFVRFTNPRTEERPNTRASVFDYAQNPPRERHSFHSGVPEPASTPVRAPVRGAVRSSLGC